MTGSDADQGEGFDNAESEKRRLSQSGYYSPAFAQIATAGINFDHTMTLTRTATPPCRIEIRDLPTIH